MRLKQPIITTPNKKAIEQFYIKNNHRFLFNIHLWVYKLDLFLLNISKRNHKNISVPNKIGEYNSWIIVGDDQGNATMIPADDMIDSAIEKPSSNDYGEGLWPYDFNYNEWPELPDRSWVKP